MLLGVCEIKWGRVLGPLDVDLCLQRALLLAAARARLGPLRLSRTPHHTASSHASANFESSLALYYPQTMLPFWPFVWYVHVQITSSNVSTGPLAPHIPYMMTLPCILSSCLTCVCTLSASLASSASFCALRTAASICASFSSKARTSPPYIPRHTSYVIRARHKSTSHVTCHMSHVTCNASQEHRDKSRSQEVTGSRPRHHITVVLPCWRWVARGPCRP